LDNFGIQSFKIIIMELKKASVFITGGSDGIGRGLAARFLRAGSEVLVTGRQAKKLDEAATALPGLKTFVNDIGLSEERERLAAHLAVVMPGVNVVINNAGIQRRVGLAVDDAPWAVRQQEIDILLSAPIHLNHLLIPLLLGHGKESVIINVTSGGAYIPQVFAPVYSACKAALHSYTMTLRHALAGTRIRVVELIPPAVQTGLAGPGAAHGADADEFCDAVFPLLVRDDRIDVGFGPTDKLVPELSGRPIAEIFQTSSSTFSVATYLSSVKR
jgi:uncharacterized oxidoreductase